MLTAEQEGVIRRITALMSDAGMTMRDFTEAIGVHATTVTEWKKGRTRPSVDHVRCIAKLFNVSTDYIINGTDYKSSPASEIDVSPSHMLSVFSQLSHEHKLIVASFMVDCIRFINEETSEDASALSAEDEESVDDLLQDFHSKYGKSGAIKLTED